MKTCLAEVKYTKDTAMNPAVILDIKIGVSRYIKNEKIPKSIAKPRPEKIVNPNNFIDFDLLIKSLTIRRMLIFLKLKYC